MGLRIHRLADKSDGRGLPWPLAGVRLLEVPETVDVPTSVVETGLREGWIISEGGRIVNRPSRADRDDLSQPHTFVHYDRLTFRTVDGDIGYRVTHQPDKYADFGAVTYPGRVEAFDADDETPVTAEIYAAGATRVDHFYGLVREG